MKVFGFLLFLIIITGLIGCSFFKDLAISDDNVKHYGSSFRDKDWNQFDTIVIHKPIVTWESARYLEREKINSIAKINQRYKDELLLKFHDKTVILDSTYYENVDKVFVRVENGYRWAYEYFLGKTVSDKNDFHLFIYIDQKQNFYNPPGRGYQYSCDSTRTQLMIVSVRKKKVVFYEAIKQIEYNPLNFNPSPLKVKSGLQQIFKKEEHLN